MGEKIMRVFKIEGYLERQVLAWEIRESIFGDFIRKR